MVDNVRRGNNGKIRVPVAEFGAKFSTKKECYDFLSQQAGCYIPPKDTVTIWHLRDLAMGVKRIIRGADVQHLSVPQYDSLSLDKMLLWAKQYHPSVLEQYLPVEREVQKLPK